MKIVIGLGNPGSEYELSRHNIGFLFLDYYAKKHRLGFSKEKKFYSSKRRETLFIKPTTFMNLSGDVIAPLKNKYLIEDILVVVDDINIPLGEVRIRKKGGDGGHNGLKSIDKHLNSNEYKRIRIGVGSNQEKNLSKYVLSNFLDYEMKILNETFDFVSNLMDLYVYRTFPEMLNYYSKNLNSYSDKIKEYQNLMAKGGKNDSKI